MRWCWWHHMTQTWVMIVGQVSSEIFWEWAEEWILTEEKQNQNLNLASQNIVLTLFIQYYYVMSLFQCMHEYYNCHKPFINFINLQKQKFLLLLTQGLEECQGLGPCSLAEVCCLSTPKHFEVYHQKYEETIEAVFQTFCTWNKDIHIKVQPLI